MILCCAHKNVFLRCFKQVFRLLLACSLIAVNAWGQESTRILSGNLKDGVEPLHIRYPLLGIHNIYRTQGVYAFELLHLLCEKSGRPYILKEIPLRTIPWERIVLYVQNEEIDVMLQHTNLDLEEALKPVRYPVYRGLVGWRIFFIRAADVNRMSNIQSLADMKRLKAGQGYTWPDTEVLKSNGFHVRSALDYQSLFKMLDSGRIDYFPRSVVEIKDEVTKFPSEKFVVEKSIVLRYPTAAYFFVADKNQALADLIALGFENALEDGSFQALFMRYFGNNIRWANLQKRKIFSLSNPHLSSKTPLKRKELWFSPDSLLQDSLLQENLLKENLPNEGENL